MALTVYIHVKKLGRKVRTPEACPYELMNCPGTLRELISMMVRDGVASYNSRLKQTEPGGVLSTEELESMSRVGKIAFGIPFGSLEASPEDAVETAVSGFADGLYRFFINDTECTALDAPLTLREHDTITILRLVMLTGGFF